MVVVMVVVIVFVVFVFIVVVVECNNCWVFFCWFFLFGQDIVIL